MIKVAISGADTRDAGELIRILLNHPEVEITAMSAPSKEGLPPSAIHHGMVGESLVNFTSSVSSSDKADVLFICDNTMSAAELSAMRLSRPELKIILLHTPDGFDLKANGVVYGLPEINRKLLVRGATTAIVPSPGASAALVALYPLALHMLLNPNLFISFRMPQDLIDSSSEATVKELREMLSEVQKSLTEYTEPSFRATDHPRNMEVEVLLDSSIDLQHILEMYGMYDDHNFSFPITGSVSTEDVSGTDKCLFTISKPNDSQLLLHIVADPRMRGGAGEAVHIMNLLCGLHEKTGLAFKTTRFSPLKTD